MPYGIHNTSEVLQVKGAKIIEGTEGCLNSQDGILIWADSKEEHDHCVHEVPLKVRASGSKLNKSKCVLGLTELKFFILKTLSLNVVMNQIQIKFLRL